MFAMRVCECGVPVVVELDDKFSATVAAKFVGMIVHEKGCVSQDELVVEDLFVKRVVKALRKPEGGG
jgi:hypothetical protein